MTVAVRVCKNTGSPSPPKAAYNTFTVNDPQPQAKSQVKMDKAKCLSIIDNTKRYNWQRKIF